MHSALSSALGSLLPRTDSIRNFCMLAHVDHGKTTLSDHLVSSNGIISNKLAGQVRYLDSREDEQKKLITMKSSAVALIYLDKQKLDPAKPEEVTKVPFLMNLIDSPGHVDFSSEVGAATRLCDGCLVLVDVVEGVCVQTQAVLRQAWKEGLEPVLILNKMDRLYTETQMSTTEAYQHLLWIVEQVNAVVSAFYTQDVMAKAADADEVVGRKRHRVKFSNSSKQWHFSPELGNVIFCSSIDRWAFQVPQMARFWAQKLGMNAAKLQKCMWGEYYYDPKKKSVSKKPNKSGKTMFTAMVLDNIWAVYDCVENFNMPKLNKIIKVLNIKVPAHELKGKASETHSRLTAVMGKWLPIPEAVLSTVVTHLPSPIVAQQKRMKMIWKGLYSPDTCPVFKQDVLQCNKDSPHMLMFVSKMLDSSQTTIVRGKTANKTVGQRSTYVKGKISNPQVAEQEGDDSDDDTSSSDDDENDENVTEFMGIARVFCGTFGRSKTAQAAIPPCKHCGANAFETNIVYAMGPKFDADRKADTEKFRTKVPLQATRSWLLIGRDRQAQDTVPAGCVFGVTGLDTVLLKSGTVSSEAQCHVISPISVQSTPIVRVAIEPVLSSNMIPFMRGLKLLNQADANVEVSVLPTGEHVIATSGELHLERCLRDMADRFAHGIRMRVSPPLISYKETIVVEDNAQLKTAAKQAAAQKKMAAAQKATKKSHELFTKGDDMLEEVFGDELARLYDDQKAATKTVSVKDSITVTKSTVNGEIAISVRAIPLPARAVALMTQNLQEMNKLDAVSIRKEHVSNWRQATTARGDDKIAAVADEAVANEAVVVVESKLTSTETKATDTAAAVAAVTAVAEEEEEEEEEEDTVVEFLTDLDGILCKTKGFEAGDVRDLWSFGPPQARYNVLINRTENKDIRDLSALVRPAASATEEGKEDEPHALFASLINAFVNGFRMTCAEGPLCAEPMEGVAFVIDSIVLQDNIQISREDTSFRALSGHIIQTMNTSLTSAFKKHSPRIKEAMFRIEMQCEANVLGVVEGVIAGRRGKIVSANDMVEGTTMFVVHAFIPVSETFGFAREIRKSSGGSANPQLTFSHWQILSEDPFWQPTTEEEMEEFGDTVADDKKNLAFDLITAVRKRKGLPLWEKLVKDAAKQRTLTRNK